MAMVDTPWSSISVLGSALLAGMLTLRPRNHRLQSVFGVGLLAVWMMLSFTWSLQPNETLKACVRTFLLLAAAALMARTLSGRQVVAVLSLGTSALAALSLVWWVLYPSTAITSAGLKGMMPHNNALAYLATVAIASSVMASGLPRGLRVGVVVLDAVVLFLSDSMTSNLAAVAGLFAAGAVVAVSRLQGASRRALTALAGGVLASIAYLSVFVPLPTLIGRDTTLTGRTTIWPGLWPIAMDRWLTGWGHGAPWLKGSWIREWSAYHFDFAMISTHNALYETFMQLGVVGVGLVVGLWAVALVRAVRGAAATRENAWLVALAVLQLVHGLAESTQGMPLGWLVTALVWLARPVAAGSEGVEPVPVRLAKQARASGLAPTAGVPR